MNRRLGKLAEVARDLDGQSEELPLRRVRGGLRHATGTPILRKGARARPGTDTGDNVGYRCGGDTQINVYLSPNAGTATFTIAGFDVDDIETVVAELTQQGVTFEQYDQPPIVTDAQGIAHFEGDAKVAYFKDPDGNILSLAQAPK